MSCNSPVSFCPLLYDSGVAIGVYNEAQWARRSECTRVVASAAVHEAAWTDSAN